MLRSYPKTLERNSSMIPPLMHGRGSNPTLGGGVRPTSCNRLKKSSTNTFQNTLHKTRNRSHCRFEKKKRTSNPRQCHIRPTFHWKPTEIDGILPRPFKFSWSSQNTASKSTTELVSGPQIAHKQDKDNIRPHSRLPLKTNTLDPNVDVSTN